MSVAVWMIKLHPPSRLVGATIQLSKKGLQCGATPLTIHAQYASSGARSAFRRAPRHRTLKEIFTSPATDTAFNVGKGVLAGSSAFGIGALCYYGLGLSKEAGALERSMIWPQYVKDRIKATYSYFGGGLLLTAASAVAVSRSPALMGIMLKNSWIAITATFATMICSGIVVRSIPYTEGIGAKQVAWVVYNGIMGAVVAPLCLLGGPLVIRAAWYTAGVVGGLSAVAACAPSEKFLSMGGPLAVGLGLVFASSVGAMFLSPTTALGAGLYSISLYGGLVLFGGFLVYDTQRIVHIAENHPTYVAKPYDPINTSISIYLDTLNIFMRIAMLLAGGGSPRRK